MKKGTACIEVAMPRAQEQKSGTRVYADPEGGDPKNGPGRNLDDFAKAVNSFPRDRANADQNRDRVGERGEHGRLSEAISMSLGRLSLRKDGRTPSQQ